jgi:hypothetical protein
MQEDITNIADAKDTVASITKDLDHQTIKENNISLQPLLADRGVKVVNWPSYELIDAIEMDDKWKRSEHQLREKIPYIDDLLCAAHIS